MISANQNTKVPAGVMKPHGTFKIADNPGLIEEFMSAPYLDMLGETAGIYDDSPTYTDGKGGVHSKMNSSQSIEFDLGHDPELTWFWITDEACRGNDDYAFLIRAGIFKAPKGYQSMYSKGSNFGGLLDQFGLLKINSDLEAIKQDPRYTSYNQITV